ncbi:MAG: lysylphosphatidylglycerol synthase domain-containing protein [Gemmatimonadota bacterium]
MPDPAPPEERLARAAAPGRLLRLTLATALVAATLVFLGLAIARNWAEIAAHDWNVRPLHLAASVGLLVLALASGVVVWHRVVLRFQGHRIPLRTLLRVWFLSNLARYVPGKIWQFVGAVQLGRQAGIAPAVLLTSLVVLTGLTLVAAALISLAALPTVFAELGWAGVTFLVTGAVLGIAGVHPAVINYALGKVPERLHPENLTWTGSWLDGIGLLTLSFGAWTLHGLAFALFTHSLVGTTAAAVPALVAANALAFLIGYMALVTPGGLGAREAALALMLGPLGSLGVAAVIAVAFRLWLIVGELLGAALFFRPQRSRSSEDGSA